MTTPTHGSVGYSPDLVVGVWVGHDDPRSLGAIETGGRAALPIWIDFMKEALADRPDPGFDLPEGVERVRIDRRTGLRSTGDCEETFREVFVTGTGPARRCTRSVHDRRLLSTLERTGDDRSADLSIVEEFDVGSWIGTDGRPATVVPFDKDANAAD